MKAWRVDLALPVYLPLLHPRPTLRRILTRIYHGLVSLIWIFLALIQPPLHYPPSLIMIIVKYLLDLSLLIAHRIPNYVRDAWRYPIKDFLILSDEKSEGWLNDCSDTVAKRRSKDKHSPKGYDGYHFDWEEEEENDHKETSLADELNQIY